MIDQWEDDGGASHTADDAGIEHYADWTSQMIEAEMRLEDGHGC